MDAAFQESGGAAGASQAALPIAVYLINLDRSPERLAAIAPQLDRLGLPWQRLPAVDGRSVDGPWPDYDASFFERRWGKRHSPGAYGCYMSHVRALRAFRDGGKPFGLIVEDDAQLGDDLAAVLAELLAMADRWDVVKLHGWHRGTPATTAGLRHGRRLVSFLQRQTGSTAYLVNRRAAESYLAGLLPMRVPFDHEFDKAWRYGIRLRGVLPMPVGVLRGPSTIGDATLVPGSRAARLPYRAGVELARIRHYLFVDREWMRRRPAARDDATTPIGQPATDRETP